MTSPFKALKLAQEQIADLDLKLLKRKLRITESPCDTNLTVGNRQLTAFCSNDYLGLANHPDLVQALARNMVLVAAPPISSAVIAQHMNSLRRS